MTEFGYFRLGNIFYKIQGPDKTFDENSVKKTRP